MSGIYIDLLGDIQAAAAVPSADATRGEACFQALYRLRDVLEIEENTPRINKRRQTELARTRQALASLLNRRES